MKRASGILMYPIYRRGQSQDGYHIFVSLSPVRRNQLRNNLTYFSSQIKWRLNRRPTVCFENVACLRDCGESRWAWGIGGTITDRGNQNTLPNCNFHTTNPRQAVMGLKLWICGEKNVTNYGTVVLLRNW